VLERKHAAQAVSLQPSACGLPSMADLRTRVRSRNGAIFLWEKIRIFAIGKNCAGAIFGGISTRLDPGNIVYK
jgi:hypothetical protein